MTTAQDTGSSLARTGIISIDPIVIPTTTSGVDAVRKLYRHDCRYECCEQRWSEFAVVDEEHVDLAERTA
jgi:hypothetical protein